jgi:hypothetical protein
MPTKDSPMSRAELQWKRRKLTRCGKNADEGQVISRAAEMEREASETHKLW